MKKFCMILFVKLFYLVLLSRIMTSHQEMDLSVYCFAFSVLVSIVEILSITITRIIKKTNNSTEKN